MKVLTRANFDTLETTGSDLPRELVSVPEWADPGDDPTQVFACVRSLMGWERDQYEASLQSGPNRTLNLENARAKLVALCLIDPTTGERLFSSKEAHLLGKRSAKALDRLFDVCRKLNGLTKEAVTDLATELKNDQSAVSGSD